MMRGHEASLIPKPLLTLEQVQSSSEGGYLPLPVTRNPASSTELLPRTEPEEPYGGVGHLGMTLCSTGGTSTCKLFYLVNAGCYSDPILDLPHLQKIRWSKLNSWRW